MTSSPTERTNLVRRVWNRLATPGRSDPNLPAERAPTDIFWSDHYMRHNQRRLEHLASLQLQIAGSTVLEVGAGIGDHTTFFLDRECTVVSAEPRADNLRILRARYPGLRAERLDLDDPDDSIPETFEIVYCYGTLYHLHKPAEAISFMAERCDRMLLLETCVSPGDGEEINLVPEMEVDPSQSIHGFGCRPTRKWVFNELRRHFEFVYLPTTQPCHEEFPLDWRGLEATETLTRSVFVASRSPLDHSGLLRDIPELQIRG